MGILSRARDAISKARKFDPELAYLEEATSIIDLENRMKEIDRGRFRRRRSLPF